MIGEGTGIDAGIAWCPTRLAQAELQSAGMASAPAPPLACLRRVNSRAFCADLGQTLDGAGFFSETEPLLRALGQFRGAYRLKRNYSVAGRGQRRGRGPVDDAGRAFIDASMRTGGLQLEPDVTIESELVVHGFIDGQAVLVAGPMRQCCDAYGAFVSAEPLEEFAAERRRFIEEAERVGAALREAGYFGPFGVDGYVYREAGGVRLNPRSEINARFTLAYPVRHFRTMIERAFRR